MVPKKLSRLYQRYAPNKVCVLENEDMLWALKALNALLDDLPPKLKKHKSKIKKAQDRLEYAQYYWLITEPGEDIIMTRTK